VARGRRVDSGAQHPGAGAAGLHVSGDEQHAHNDTGARPADDDHHHHPDDTGAAAVPALWILTRAVP
jgi:hypothetical protein